MKVKSKYFNNYVSNAKLLYKPTEKKLDKVISLYSKMKSNGIHFLVFDKSLKLDGVALYSSHKITCDGLGIRFIEVEQSHCFILVHWYPNYKVSVRRDPFCSIFSISERSIDRLSKYFDEAYDGLMNEVTECCKSIKNKNK